MTQEKLEYEPIRRRVSVKMSVIARHLRMQFDKSVGSEGVTRAQWTMIAFISRQPGSSQRQIADVLEQSEASVGRVIDKLVKEGLLERRQKEDDRRTYAIYLTGKAEPLLAKLTAFATRTEGIAFAGIDEESLVRFEQLLNTIYANVQAERCAEQE